MARRHDDKPLKIAGLATAALTIMLVALWPAMLEDNDPAAWAIGIIVNLFAVACATATLALSIINKLH